MSAWYARGAAIHPPVIGGPASTAYRGYGYHGGVRLTVLGACGAWPEAGSACSGFLLEHQGFQLAIDLGYATVPRLFELTTADRLDAVFISHGHPDHCADLNPLLRARFLGSQQPTALPVYALPGALNAVLSLDGQRMLDAALDLREVPGNGKFEIGPFKAETALLPHWGTKCGFASHRW